MSTTDEIRAAIRGLRPGDKVVVLLRDGAEETAVVDRVGDRRLVLRRADSGAEIDLAEVEHLAQDLYISGEAE